MRSLHLCCHLLHGLAGNKDLLDGNELDVLLLLRSSGSSDWRGRVWNWQDAITCLLDVEFDELANITSRLGLQCPIPRQCLHKLICTQADSVDTRGIQIIQAMWQG